MPTVDAVAGVGSVDALDELTGVGGRLDVGHVGHELEGDVDPVVGSSIAQRPEPGCCVLGAADAAADRLEVHASKAVGEVPRGGLEGQHLVGGRAVGEPRGRDLHAPDPQAGVGEGVLESFDVGGVVAQGAPVPHEETDAGETGCCRRPDPFDRVVVGVPAHVVPDEVVRAETVGTSVRVGHVHRQ